MLKLLITPDQLQLNPEALGIQGLTGSGTSQDVNLSVQVEVDLLELYEPDELLEMLRANAPTMPPQPPRIALELKDFVRSHLRKY